MARYAALLLAHQRDQAIQATHQWAAHARHQQTRIHSLQEEVARPREEISQRCFRIEDLHPEIRARCGSLIEQRNFEDAVRRAMIAVEVGVRQKTGLDRALSGLELISAAMAGQSPPLRFSDHPSEQEATHLLFRGAFGSFRNVVMHNFSDQDHPPAAWEIIAFASRLLHLLDAATVEA